MRIRKQNRRIVGSFVMTALTLLLTLGLVAGFLPNFASGGRGGAGNLPPVAVAVADNEEGIVGESMKFNGGESYDSDGSIVSYEWNFGDGFTDVGVSVIHAYRLHGTYNVTLIVTDDGCAIDIDIIIIIIIDPNTPPPCENIPPVPVPEPRYQEIMMGDEALFDGSMSYDMDGTIVEYGWDFGDGTTGSGVTIGHVYYLPMDYWVTLTVWDDDGASGSEFCLVRVLDDCPPPPTENIPPVAVPEPCYQLVLVGEEAFFDGSKSYDLDGTIESHHWDFGDNSNASGMTVNHVYDTPGRYIVTLTVTDDDGASGLEFCYVEVLDECPPPPENIPPVAVPEPCYQLVLVGEEAFFDGSKSYDPDGTIVSYQWDFGDNSNASGMTVTHAYDTPGRYIVTLTVTDDEGASGLGLCYVEVLDDCPPPPTENIPPVAVPEPCYQLVLVGEETFFDGSKSYDPDGTIVSYQWDFGDNSNASGMTVTHAYDTPGRYIVTLTVTDDEGAWGSEFCYVEVLDECPPPPTENIPPVAVAQPRQQEIMLNETAVFDGSLSHDIDGIIVSYEWDFGDGTAGSGQTIAHQYSAPGCYNVILAVTDDGNETGHDIIYVLVTEPKAPWPDENIAPTAVAQPKYQEVLAGESAVMDGSGSFDEDGYIVAYIWTPCWGTVFCGETVSIPFDEPGTYTVMLIVEDDQGATGSDTITIDVLEREVPPEPDPGEDLPDIERDDDKTGEGEPLLILTAGLINMATFSEGMERAVPVEVTAYYGDVRLVHIELIDDGGLEIEVIPISMNVREGKVVRFYLRITVPELPDDVSSSGITIKLKAVGSEAESNVEQIDVLISEKGGSGDSNTTETASTVGTIGAAGILALLLKRRFL